MLYFVIIPWRSLEITTKDVAHPFHVIWTSRTPKRPDTKNHHVARPSASFPNKSLRPCIRIESMTIARLLERLYVVDPWLCMDKEVDQPVSLQYSTLLNMNVSKVSSICMI